MNKDNKQKKEKEEPVKLTGRDNVVSAEITDELQTSYLDYAMSVIVSRALPDVRDGLKPVHRRILWAMWDAGLAHSSRYRKSANVVGEVLGKYHPHGDSSVYDAMVRMAQTFSLRYPMIDGQGNWGSQDGDNAAAMRYCITGDALVVTDKGLIPISKISDSKKEGGINIKIVDYGGNAKQATSFFNSGKHKTIKITTRSGYELKGSYNHPVLVWSVNEFGFPLLEWKLLQNISAGDVAVINRGGIFSRVKNLNLKKFYPEKKYLYPITLPTKMSKELAFVLGAVVSEGSFHQNKILFCNSDKNFYNKTKKFVLNEFKGIKLYERNIAENCAQFEIYHQQVVNLLKNIGLNDNKSDKKEIPFSILQSDKNTIRQFLKSLFEGDGSVILHKDKRHGGKSIELCYHSKSLILMNQLKTLLLGFGIVTNNLYLDKRHLCYKLVIGGHENILRFEKEINFFSSRKRKVLANIHSMNSNRMRRNDSIPFLNEYLRSVYSSSFISRHNFDRYNKLSSNFPEIKNLLRTPDKKLIEWILRRNYFFDPIKNISKLPEEVVYSLRVDSSSHSFVANGFINHNTECRLSKIAEEMCFDIEKDTVDFVPNYDASKKEPKVMPAKIPSLLINGSMGIAVGMATDIPPHNLTEVIDATLFVIEKPSASNNEILKFIKGPDFPTGGIIYDGKNIKEAYTNGQGSITCRAKTEITERKTGQFNIAISEIPYRVNKSELIQKIAELASNKKIEGMKDLRDESDKEGLSIVIELKNDVSPQKILNQLFKHTELQKDFHLNMIALINGIQPQLLSVKDFIEQYIAYRKEVVKRRTEFDLAKTKERAHILEGLTKALDHIDDVIKTIKKSKDKDEAKINLIQKFKLTEIQAIAILEMKLQTLASLERQKIEDELKEKRRIIKELEAILASPKKILEIIQKELKEIREKYGDERRTQVVETGLSEFKEEDLIPREETIITLSQSGYIKRVDPGAFRVQQRGGKGLIGSEVKEDDFVSHLEHANTHDDILFFTNSGKVFQTKVYEIPEGSRTSKGKMIHNFLDIPPIEHIQAIVARNAKSDKFANLVMATKNGIVKKTPIGDFANVRRNGILGINLKKGDSLVSVKPSSGKDEIFIVTSNGHAIRFKESQLRPMGRSAAGVKGIKLKKNAKGADFVVGIDIINKDSEMVKQKILVVMESGFAKQTSLKEYKVQSRGGQGIITAKVNEKTGKVVAFEVIMNEESVMVVSAKGQIIKSNISDIRESSRPTSGVRVMRLNADDKIVAMICV